MKISKEFLMSQTEQHFNELVLNGLQVSRLVGCGESDMDFYWKLDEGFSPRYAKNGNGVYYLSAVTTPLFLKDQLSHSVYVELDELRTLNGAPYAEKLEWEYVDD